MKKFTLLAVAALAMTFASCKKDYTCTCTNTWSGAGSPPAQSVSSITIHSTKGKATDACTALNSTYVSGGYTDTESCVIK